MVVPITESSSNIGAPRLLSRNGSFQQERQISVDPISLKESAFVLPHLKPCKFLSYSLPGSAASSPRFSSPVKKRWKNHSQIQIQKSSSIDPITGQHSLALSRLAQLQEIHLRRSQSCGQGRITSSSIDLEMFSRRFKTKYLKEISSFQKKDHGKDDVESIKGGGRKGIEGGDDGKFKCGACLFLPGFGKAKPVRPNKMEQEINDDDDDDDDNIEMMTMMTRESNEKEPTSNNMISRRVSLEKFECASWTTSLVVMDGEEEDMTDGDSLFFDLPMELIRKDGHDTESPVSTAFVFDGDLKGVLKKAVVGSGIDSRKSVESGSSRHVRFSDASPKTGWVIPPRSHKDKGYSNALLKAQTG